MASFKTFLAASAVILTFAGGATWTVDQHAIPVKVADKVASQALPFRLSDVRLLDGPFRDAMMRDQQYLLSLDPDRLLHNFRVTAGLPSTAQPLGGWEAPETSSCAGTPSATTSRRVVDDVREHRRRALQGARRQPGRASWRKVQDGRGRKKFHPGYLSAYPEELFDRVETRQRGVGAVLHDPQDHGGLLDAYQLCGNAQALDVLKRQAGLGAVPHRSAHATSSSRRCSRPSSAA